MASPKKGKKRYFLFALEILLVILLIGGLYIYGQVNERLDKFESEQPEFHEEAIAVNKEVLAAEEEEMKQGDAVSAQARKLSGFKTIALFGIDYRDKNEALGGQNSDTMIIASINNDSSEVRLVSVYRDTLLNIGSDTYAKANAAYAYGGPEQAISMLNTNLDLDIEEYVTVDFSALAAAVDALGGLDIPLSYAEIVHMNNYCRETSEETGKEYTPVDIPYPAPEGLNQEAIYGTYHLNGVQATSYCRIRYTASLDMGRTERQRRVIQMLVTKARTTGLTNIFKVMDEVFPLVKTSIKKTELLSMIPSMMGYGIANTMGFPFDYKFSDIKGSIIVPTDLISNVSELHEFLYGVQGYVPSSVVQSRSEMIIAIVGGAEHIVDEAPVYSEDSENTADDDFYWQDPNSGSDINISDGYNSYNENYNYNYNENYNENSGGGTDYSGGNTGYEEDLSGGTGTNTDYSGGGTDYSGGGTDYSGGGTDYSGGGTDYSGGGETDYGGGTEYSGGGETDYGGGDYVDYGGGDTGGDYGDYELTDG